MSEYIKENVVHRNTKTLFNYKTSAILSPTAAATGMEALHRMNSTRHSKAHVTCSLSNVGWTRGP